MVNDIQTEATRTYGPERVKVSTDGGWLLDAKEKYQKITAEMDAEKAENDYHDALDKARNFADKLNKIFGINLQIDPGTTTVVIDGLYFTNAPRYSLTYWAVCHKCGEPAINFEVFNSGDLMYALNSEDGTKRLCESCERKSWVARSNTSPSTPELTPLEKLGSALIAYITSLGTEE